MGSTNSFDPDERVVYKAVGNVRLSLDVFNHRDGSNPYYYGTVFEADRFLASLGCLEGAPTVQSDTVEATRP